MSTLSNPFAPHLEAVISLARRAGESILYHYEKQSGAISKKSDGTPVTEADRASEAILIFGLESITPALPILSEEQVSLGHIPSLAGGVYWSLDPLDGTREYLNRTGEFSICIGGISAAQAVFGLVYAPLMQRLYISDGTRSWRVTETGERLLLKGAVARRDKPIALVSRSHWDGGELDEFLSKLAIGKEQRRPMGSAVKFGMIAEAEADFYVRFGATHQWDTAAGQAIVECSGGSVCDHNGARLIYPSDRLLNPGFMARAFSP